MNRSLKFLYGLALLGLGTILAVLLIKTATSHDTAMEHVVETKTAFPDYVEQINSYYKNFDNRKSHFHQTEERYMLPMEQQENCLTCHSLWPHMKDKRTRAFNNQHSRYLSCMVCHVDEQDGRPVEFDWYNFGVDNSITRQGPYGITEISEGKLSGEGNFVSKIIPLIADGNIKTRLYATYDTPMYAEYREAVDAGETVNKDLIRKEAEALIGENAAVCSSCHDESSNFPWKELNFSGARLDEMLHSAVVGMVEKYDAFYFPPVFE